VLASTVGALVGNYASPSSTGAKLGFLILGIIWPMVTLVGTPFDDMFDRRAHGTMMKISYALTFAAVTLRIYLAALLTLGFDFETAFAISAWESGFPIHLLAHRSLDTKTGSGQVDAIVSDSGSDLRHPLQNARLEEWHSGPRMARCMDRGPCYFVCRRRS
jgi:hypothetical protein